MWFLLQPKTNEVVHKEPERSLKQTRERLDLVAESNRMKWSDVQLIAQDLFGKTKGFTIGECQRLMKEIRKGK